MEIVSVVDDKKGAENVEVVATYKVLPASLLHCLPRIACIVRLVQSIGWSQENL